MAAMQEEFHFDLAEKKSEQSMLCLQAVSQGGKSSSEWLCHKELRAMQYTIPELANWPLPWCRAQDMNVHQTDSLTSIELAFDIWNT